MKKLSFLLRREQTDQDAREIRILKERFIEEEDNGQERERKFRWKHLDNVDNNDQPLSVDQETNEGHESDSENEEEWRRSRFEREQLLKQQVNDSVVIILSYSFSVRKIQILNKDFFLYYKASEKSLAAEVAEESQSIIGKNTTISLFRRSLVVKTASPKIVSPFLINRSELNVGHLSRKSFLNRDTLTLEKLVSLTKSATDGDTILNTAKAKGNYVFVATEKKQVNTFFVNLTFNHI